MKVVLFHSGSLLPHYLDYGLGQLRLFNPSIDIYMLTDEKHLDDAVFEKYDVIVFNKDLYHTDKASAFSKLYRKAPDNFWVITATRLMYIEEFMFRQKLNEVYHFENDVLVYYPIKSLHSRFKRWCGRRIGITPGGPNKLMTGYMYIPSSKPLKSMTQYFLFLLETYGMQGIKRTFGVEMVNEMILMKIYANAKQDMVFLPILPSDKGYDYFGSLFDPASWGQFVGGTTDCVPGAKAEDHHIGQYLRKNPEFKVVWILDEKGKRIPHFFDCNQLYKINNLHIHSKQLGKYVS